jgi:redox-sensitive bicupin YhaK (pirin superfamily)
VSEIDVRRAGSRAHTETAWLDSWHSFSFGPHHDPANTHHGLLRVSNDDRIRAATGFGTHHHEDMEIVTWVLSGTLEHHDSEGNHGELYPGLAQRMSAGSGIEHSETNPSAHEDVHLVQMWVFPDARGIAPGYEQRDINPELALGGLRPIVSGAGHDGAIAIHQRDAVLWAGRLRPGETATVPDGPHVHVFVAAGDVALAGAGRLDPGDAARLTAAGSPALDAGTTGAELLVWVTA